MDKEVEVTYEEQTEYRIGRFVTSLKRLPNKATKVIAIISTVICGILNVCSMIPAALSFFAIFSFMITIGI